MNLQAKYKLIPTVLLFVFISTKPLEGRCDVVSPLLNILTMGIRSLAEESTKKPKEEPPKEEKKEEEVKPEIEEKRSGGKVKYRSGGYVRSADGIAKRGKTRGRIV